MTEPEIVELYYSNPRSLTSRPITLNACRSTRRLRTLGQGLQQLHHLHLHLHRLKPAPSMQY